MSFNYDDFVISWANIIFWTFAYIVVMGVGWFKSEESNKSLVNIFPLGFAFWYAHHYIMAAYTSYDNSHFNYINFACSNLLSKITSS